MDVRTDQILGFPRERSLHIGHYRWIHLGQTVTTVDFYDEFGSLSFDRYAVGQQEITARGEGNGIEYHSNHNTRKTCTSKATHCSRLVIHRPKNQPLTSSILDRMLDNVPLRSTSSVMCSARKYIRFDVVGILFGFRRNLNGVAFPDDADVAF